MKLIHNDVWEVLIGELNHLRKLVVMYEDLTTAQNKYIETLEKQNDKYKKIIEAEVTAEIFKTESSFKRYWKYGEDSEGMNEEK